MNHKREHRVCREAGLSIRRKKRKHCVCAGHSLRACTAANQEWALDSLHDEVESGRAIRVLSVLDAYIRECLTLEVDTSFASRRVTHVLEGSWRSEGHHRRLDAITGFPLSDSLGGDGLSTAEQVDGSDVVL